MRSCVLLVLLIGAAVESRPYITYITRKPIGVDNESAIPRIESALMGIASAIEGVESAIERKPVGVGDESRYNTSKPIGVGDESRYITGNPIGVTIESAITRNPIGVTIESAITGKPIGVTVEGYHSCLDLCATNHRVPDTIRCNLHWESSNGGDCNEYKMNNWCKEDGDHYGSAWESQWGNFSGWADSNGRTALVCFQCGCKEDWDAETKINKDYYDCFDQCNEKHGTKAE